MLVKWKFYLNWPFRIESVFSESEKNNLEFRRLAYSTPNVFIIDKDKSLKKVRDKEENNAYFYTVLIELQ